MHNTFLEVSKGLKPYNIYLNDEDNSAEIEMYGEVVEFVPTDWWTGEPMDGLYISLKDFLADLDGLKMRDKVTVRINSVGGDLFAGVSIYNRLSEMKDVTTIVDGLAASAASIIAQAGKKRCVYNSSQIMIHGASTLLLNWYNAQDLELVLKQLNSANDAVVNVYAERIGESKTKLKHMVEATTWMTGQDAVDKGFADEVISGGNISMSMAADRSLFLCNGIPLNMRQMPAIPKGVDIVDIDDKANTAETADSIEKNPEKGEIIMDLKTLRNEHPELVKEIEDAAIANVDNTEAINSAVEAERKRIQEIESIENTISDKELINKAKYGDTTMTAKDLAFEAMKNQAIAADNFLKNREEEIANSGASQVSVAANSGIEETDSQQADIDFIRDTMNLVNGGAK